ncbi:MAG: NAD(+) synthase, partial [Candidatus Neomarinimicrobiota bacterium]
MTTIALAQINPTVGDIGGNLELHRRALAEVGDRAELVIFPECALPGYPAKDLLLESAFLADLEAALETLAAEVADQFVITGTVREESSSGSGSGSSSKKLYNTTAVLHQGKIVAHRDKSCLPTYDVFDEARYFTPARNIEPVELTLPSGEILRVGLQICEDLWDADYEAKVTDRLGEQGVDLFINISASPFTVDRDPRRRELIAGKVRRWGKPFIYCNLVGGQDELVFDGRSLVFDSQGQLIKEGASFNEDLILINYPLDTATRLRLRYAGQAATDSREEQLTKALVLGIGDYFRKTGHQEAIIGLSGGIDSSVVAALAVRALGAENVTALALPSTYNAPASLEDARQLAEALAIELQVIDIDNLRRTMLSELAPLFAGAEPGIAEENLQARIRGTLLMAVANKRGALVLTTGNKTELALGYATLYGDMAGALAPIGDLS